MHYSGKDTVAPIHRIIASIVIFGNVFQMNYNFIFTGKLGKLPRFVIFGHISYETL